MLLLWPGNPTGHWGKIAINSPPQTNGWLISQNRSMSTMRHHLAAKKWAADNERYHIARDFDPNAFLNFCARLQFYPGHCLFVLVPDQPNDAPATQTLWQKYAPLMRQFNLPLAYAAQDGLTHLPDEDFDCLFIAGSTSFKLGPEARNLIKSAKAARKWVHIGRVNSAARTLYAWKAGADSIDGTGWPRRKARELRAITKLLQRIHAAQKHYQKEP